MWHISPPSFRFLTVPRPSSRNCRFSPRTCRMDRANTSLSRVQHLSSRDATVDIVTTRDAAVRSQPVTSAASRGLAGASRHVTRLSARSRLQPVTSPGADCRAAAARWPAAFNLQGCPTWSGGAWSGARHVTARHST